MSISIKHYHGYVARFAEPGEADKVYAFYRDGDRRDAVYLRNEELVHNQVKAGLFFTVWKDDRIHAASTLIQLANGQEIDCVKNYGRANERGRVVEVSSVLNRSREFPDRHGDYPRHFFHGILFGVPMLEAFRQAGKEVTGDLVVANVQQHLKHTATELQSRPRNTRAYNQQIDMSPHAWRPFDAAAQLEDAFRATTNDPNARSKELPKDYYRALVENIPDVAKYLRRIADSKKIVNAAHDQLHIDMNALPVSDYAHLSTKRSLVFFRGRDDMASWNETRRRFYADEPKDRHVANGNGVSHMSGESSVKGGAGSEPSRTNMLSGTGPLMQPS